MVCINETQLMGREKVSLDPYACWTKNRTKKGGGGIATAVGPRHKNSVMGAGEGEGEDEYLITRINSFSPVLNIVNCYGEQRGVGKEEIEARWARLRKELEDIRARKEFCCLTGDLNKLVGNDSLGVPGNKAEVSAGGKLLRGLLEGGDWVLVNGMGQEVVEGGPFTRADPATGGLSCLDLFVVSRELRPYVSSLYIDSDKKWTLARSMKVRGRSRLVHSDHFPCLLTFNNLPRGQEAKEEKQTKWNLAKEGGWEKYEKVSDDLADKVKEALKDDTKTVEETKIVFDRVHDKIRFKSFGKVTIDNNKHKEEHKEEDSGDDECKGTTEEEKAEELFKEQQRVAAEELEKIEKSSKNKVGKVWEIKKTIIGGKKAAQEATAILNPTTCKLAVSKKEIKEVSLKYCIETLANNKPEEGFEEEIDRKKKLVQDLLKLK